MAAGKSCSEISALLSDFVERRFGLADHLRIRYHFFLCRTCKVYYRQFVQIYRVSGRVDPVDLPEDFDKVMEQVLQRWLSEGAEDPPRGPRG